MADPQNEKMFRSMGMFLPATPWDMPANFPLWARRTAEWGLESQDRAASGDKIKQFDPISMTGEVAQYAFGPSASADWLSGILKLPEAPLFPGSGTTPDGTLGTVAPRQLMIGNGENNLTQSLQGAQSQLQGALGQ
jgi:hypothetical protein